MLSTRDYLALPDLDDGFYNHEDYLQHSQNQNNDMSFTHLLSFRRAWSKGRAEPEVHNYSKIETVMRYSKRRSLRSVASDSTLVKRFKHYPQILLGVLFYLWPGKPCFLSSKVSLSVLELAVLSYKQPSRH
jgi:hypothetical protein